ncbi:MAG: SDR family NAD(P)-dependent oxidoreductase [Desulfobacterales bacterium]|nr:SDR family NAD(P)-dependent oxidoreductase [Desulfobacterales bacterium]
MLKKGRLQEKVAIITGSGNGIGRATALLFTREGAALVLAEIDEPALQETLRLVHSAGGRAMGRKIDVSQEREVSELVDAAMREYSRIDILCNNAGIPGAISPLEEQDAGDWNRVFQVNVMGAVYGTKYVARHMQEQRHGAIVNTSSVGGIRSGAGGNAYSASKAALINFTQTAACDLGAYNVRVNVVCPGLIETNMTKPIFDYAREKGKESKLGGRCELRRVGMPVEVAAAILFLASDEASYITGQVLPVDGGNTASLNLPGMKV